MRGRLCLGVLHIELGWAGLEGKNKYNISTRKYIFFTNERKNEGSISFSSDVL